MIDDSAGFFGLYVGFTKNIQENLDLNVSWQYMNMGQIGTRDDHARIEPHRTSLDRDDFEPFEVDIGSTEMDLVAQGLVVGLRFSF